jgi:GMP synthase (glutamine-hydrolysing)
MTHALVLRHVPFESLGLIESVLVEMGISPRFVDVPRGLPSRIELSQAALLVVLGGPIGAYQEDLYPFLTEELRLIEEQLRSGRGILGVCLGAQLMARALGSRVYAMPQKEFGWSPLTLTEEGRCGPLRSLEALPVLHWHGDTFDLPAEAIRLASTPHTPNQGFSYGDHAYALQFHPEVTLLDLEAWYVGNAAELGQLRNPSIPRLREEGRIAVPRLEAGARQTFASILEQLQAGEPHAGDPHAARSPGRISAPES